MIFTLFPDYFSRQAKRRQARKEIKTKWRQTLPQGGKKEKEGNGISNPLPSCYHIRNIIIRITMPPFRLHYIGVCETPNTA